MAGSGDLGEALASLDRAIQAGARMLSALGTRLTAGMHSDGASMINVSAQLLAACATCSSLTTITINVQLEKAASALCCCTKLPLECGMDQGTTAHFTAQAPPEALLKWLSVAVSASSALQASSQDRGVARTVQAAVVNVIARITCNVPYRHFADALRLDTALQHSAVQLLVPMLHATAVTAQLLADRWPPLQDFTRTTFDVTSALTSSALCGTFKELLTQPASDGGISTSTRLVLQLTGDAQGQRSAHSAAAACPFGSLADVPVCAGTGGSWSAADCEAAVEGLWLFHTTLCRFIHSIAAGSVDIPDVAMFRMNNKMFIALPCSMEAAVCVAKTASSGQPAAMPRHLLAMSVAHAEAVLAAGIYLPAPSDIDVAVELLSAIRHGPSALAASPPMRQALEGLAEGLGRAAEGSDAAASLRNEVVALLHREPQPGDGLELAQALGAARLAEQESAG
ncbi:hypothetical protein D9Q98_003674 [Chlorella vulgaris]|uniref:Uncharacterized protein n=1 Tax=Chlorella vulgaris TaxID=3077 RepID=A0A9D4TTC6_CHLVU|nr:hypothetical protein D9Q98_003674 [Chlorella vulgaris]